MAEFGFPKPERRATVKSRKAREAAAARRRCVLAVWERDGSRCRACGAFVVRPDGRGYPNEGHVHEVVPRSRGGDPHDPANCVLLCRRCHFSGPSGAHRGGREDSS